MTHAHRYLLLGILTGTLAPAGLVVYELLFGAPEPRIVIVTLMTGGVAPQGVGGRVIGRGEETQGHAGRGGMVDR
jgi:hypothetical protein